MTLRENACFRSDISTAPIQLALLLLGMTLAILLGQGVEAQTVSTTTVQGTVYLANGQPGSGSVLVSWPAFVTAQNQAITAGTTTVTIATDGFLSANLAPNQGATPAGLYYTAVYHLSDGTTSTEYWVVPAAAQASLSSVRAQVMPAAQAVQTVSKAYVDQEIQELTGSLLTASGGTLSGPLYLNGDPAQPLQAADKHYVDASFAEALPLTGGTLTGPLTGVRLGAVYQVDQFPGADFGAKLAACVSNLNASYGGTCDARNFTGTQTMGANLTISTPDVTVQLPCTPISTANQILVPAGTRNVALRGCAFRGTNAASGAQGGTVLLYSGTGAALQVGDPNYAVDTQGFHLDNVAINTTASTSANAQGVTAFRSQEMDVENVYLLGNSNQTGMTLDGTGNYTGGTFLNVDLSGFQQAVNAVGHQIANPATTDWMNASTFVRLHIDCPTSSGNPIAGTFGINLQQGDGNTFTGGDVEGCDTAMHLGANAQNNTIVGLRNENSNNQILADAGSAYNNWMTGGTMFTGKLTDNGTRNSFLDTFHRSFNGIKGDWYGSQQDATVTNHYRLGIGTGNERGLLDRYQSDYGYRWTTGLSDATGGEQFYQILDELNNVYRVSIGQYNNGQSSSNNQTVINAAGTGAVVLNGSNNSGTGGVVFGSGGGTENTVATIDNQGNAQFNGALQVGGASTLAGSATVKNQQDAEIDAFLWAGATTSQKESFIYKDWNGNSQWYMVKDASNNWALNSATGGLDSFKAYQNTNSGDTYVNASNSTGHIRLNYEAGSGVETDIYAGSSASLTAAFLGTTSIKFPGLAAATGHGCLQIDTSGYLSNSGAACSAGGSGTVTAGNTNQIAYYTGNGTAIAGMSTVPVTAGGTGASSVSAALTSLGAQPAMTGVSSDGANGLVVAGTVAAPTLVGGINGGIVTKQNGLKQDARLCNDAAVTNGSAAIASSCGNFASADVGKVVLVYPSGSGRTFTGTLTAVGSSSSATLSSAYTGATTSGATMILGTDDGAAFNSMVTSQIAANSAKGELSLGCRPIITTQTLLISAGRNAEIKGCGMPSGLTAGLASGAASGTPIIWAGTSTAVASLSESGNTVTLTTATAHGFYGISCAGTNRLCLVDVEGASPSGFNGTHLILSVPSATQLTYYATATGLGTGSGGYVPTQDVFRFQNCEGCSLHDVSIMGSDQPSTKPRALVDVNDTGGGPYPNSVNIIYNVIGGNLTGYGNLPGYSNLTDSTAQFGILADPAGMQDDRNQVQNTTFINVDACYANEGTTQPEDWTFSGEIGCNFSGVGFMSLGGVGWHVPGTVEDLQNGLDFLIGGGGILDVGRQNDETDGPAHVNAPQVGGPGDVAGTTMFIEGIGEGGVSDGTISFAQGGFFPSGYLPSNGDFIWTDGAGINIALNHFKIGQSGDLSEPTVVPRVDLTNTSSSNGTGFRCHDCTGLTAQNFKLPTPGAGSQNHLVVVENDALSQYGVPSHSINILAGSDGTAFDDFRQDVPAKMRIMGGYLNVAQVGSPQYMWNFGCATAGSTTYSYKITSVSGGLESPPTGEYSVSSCASTVSTTNTIGARFFGVVGADSYKIYRTVAGGASGTEHYALTVPANSYTGQIQPNVGAPNSFTDSTPDGSLGSSTPPTVNSSGEITSVYRLPALSTVPSLGTSCPVNGVVWEGEDGSTAICESGVLAAWPAVAAPASMTLTSGSGIGSGATAPACLIAQQARCTIYSGPVTFTTGTAPTSQLVKLSYTPLNPVHTLTCTISPLNAASVAAGLYVFSSNSGSWYVYAATPIASTAYAFQYVCNY